MHIGKSYKLSEFIVWTRRQIYTLLALGILPVVLYQLAGVKWLTIPLTVVALLGTAASFIVGFKNAQTYSRTVESQHVWTAILSTSRTWGRISRNYPQHADQSKDLVYRHFAWLTALRYQLRDARPWESADKASNAEYRRFFSILERETALENVLKKYLAGPELADVLARENKTARVLDLQSRALKDLLDKDQLSPAYYFQFESVLKELNEQQGKAERIKDFPYPRQYAIINTIFVRAFCILLPFGLLKEFDRLNDGISGFMQGYMIWLVIPFSVMISWMYTALEQVGESTENPFEGNANDVPITHISLLIERELRDMLGETPLPALPRPRNDIIL